MTNEDTPSPLTHLPDAPDDHLAAYAQQVAEPMLDTTVDGHLGELLMEVGNRLMVRALADEGIGQTPPIALLLVGAQEDADPQPAIVGEYVDAYDQLTLTGHIVLEHHTPEGVDDGDAVLMAQLLTQKVQLADVVNIFNPSGEITDPDALHAMQVAQQVNTPVQFTVPPTQ